MMMPFIAFFRHPDGTVEDAVCELCRQELRVSKSLCESCLEMLARIEAWMLSELPHVDQNAEQSRLLHPARARDLTDEAEVKTNAAAAGTVAGIERREWRSPLGNPFRNPIFP